MTSANIAISLARLGTANLAELEGDELATAQAELQAKYGDLELRKEVAAGLLPPRNAIPRNLREPTYRGGRRPIDIFWRVSAGIAGTPMPAGGPAAEGAPPTLSQEEVWQIVDYVQSLPFEPASQPRRRPVNVDAVN